MDVPVLEQARIQARVLVPIVKALEDELGAERAHALSGRCWAISTVAMARSSGGRRSRPALDRGWHLRSAPSRAATLSTTASSINRPTRSRSMSTGVGTQSFTGNWASPSLVSCWSAVPTFCSPRDLVLTSNSLARKPPCKAPAIATFGIDEKLRIERFVRVQLPVASRRPDSTSSRCSGWPSIWPTASHGPFGRMVFCLANSRASFSRPICA